MMSIVAWILLGVAAGVVANQLSGRRGAGLVSDALLGTAGASIAGFAFQMLAERGERSVSAWGLLVSLLGAVVFLTLSRAIVGPTRVPAPVRTQPTRRVRR